MNRRNPWQSYRQVATKTAGPGQLVQMLLEGAIGFLERGLVGFQHEDPLEFNRTINNNVLRAQAIVNELNLTLNMAEGGEIALHLRRLYIYMDRRLQESNQRKEREGIDDVIMRLGVLRDTWGQMLQQGVNKPESNDRMLA